MKPKARGLDQHGGPPGCLEDSDPAGRDFVRDRRSMPPARHITCPGLGLIYYLMYTRHRNELRHARGKTWPGTLVSQAFSLVQRLYLLS
jgi:hypothetical protein